MIFDQRIPETLAGLPGRVHRLATAEDDRDDITRQCRICLYVKTIDNFRDKPAKTGKVYRRHECRDCERKATAARSAERKHNAP